VWQDGCVLAIRNPYRNGLALPGGGIHRGEAPLDAAERELQKEVGIAAAPADALRDHLTPPIRAYLEGRARQRRSAA
jgi:8-oxo-dGTP pyrophosphatase MutT (NUDIX family)